MDFRLLNICKHGCKASNCANCERDNSEIPNNLWEKEFDKQFGDFITSALWYIPVKQFISNLFAQKYREIENLNFYDWNIETQRMIKDKIKTILK